jgi:hypothetical protein
LLYNNESISSLTVFFLKEISRDIIVSLYVLGLSSTINKINKFLITSFLLP